MPTTVERESSKIVFTKAPSIILAENVNIRLYGFRLNNMMIALKPERYITTTSADGNRRLKIVGRLLVRNLNECHDLGTVSIVKDELLIQTPLNTFGFGEDYDMTVTPSKNIIELCSFRAMKELNIAWEYCEFPDMKI